MVDVRHIGLGGPKPEKAEEKRKARGKGRTAAAGGLIPADGAGAARADFAAALGEAAEELLASDLAGYVREIAAQGERLKENPGRREFLRYRSLVAAFLKKVVAEGFDLRKQKVYRKATEYVSARIVDEKLYELGRYVLLEEQDHLELAARIDEIRGLVYDSFREKTGKDIA